MPVKAPMPCRSPNGHCRWQHSHLVFSPGLGSLHTSGGEEFGSDVIGTGI